MCDFESIGCVFDILPDKFESRVKSGKFDESLLNGVKGSDYEVPLYYVTKAWDYLLNGTLGRYAFMIGPEEDDDFSEESLREFIEEECVTRTKGQAIEDNNKMKVLWKNLFGISIDDLEVDFRKYNKHVYPQVDLDTHNLYFNDVPDGVAEWIMQGVNRPNGKSNFDSVSTLMEFAALIEVEERENSC